MLSYRIHLEGINDSEGRRQYWLRRESFRGTPYIALDFRRADGGVGTQRCFEGPTREADAAAELAAIVDRMNNPRWGA